MMSCWLFVYALGVLHSMANTILARDKRQITLLLGHVLTGFYASSNRRHQNRRLIVANYLFPL